MSHTIYVVKWNKRNGKYQERMEFRIRQFAIFRLNYLILDLGVYDARLVTERHTLTASIGERIHSEA